MNAEPCPHFRHVRAAELLQTVAGFAKKEIVFEGEDHAILGVLVFPREGYQRLSKKPGGLSLTM
jgi:hypothetical protein